jgi:hypothetical protein
MTCVSRVSMLLTHSAHAVNAWGFVQNSEPVANTKAITFIASGPNAVSSFANESVIPPQSPVPSIANSA